MDITMEHKKENINKSMEKMIMKIASTGLLNGIV